MHSDNLIINAEALDNLFAVNAYSYRGKIPELLNPQPVIRTIIAVTSKHQY